MAYPDIEPPPLGAFLAEIEAGFERLGLPDARLWAEPGRALVAGGGSVVVQVQHRRGDALYINDGVYGALADAGVLGFRYPVRLIRPDGRGAGGARRRLLVLRADLRQRRHDARSVPPAGRRRPKATGSRSASSVPMAAACAPRSTASIAPPGRGERRTADTPAADAYPPGRLIRAAAAPPRPARPSRSASRGTARSSAHRRSPRGPRCRSRHPPAAPISNGTTSRPRGDVRLDEAGAAERDAKPLDRRLDRHEALIEAEAAPRRERHRQAGGGQPELPVLARHRGVQQRVVLEVLGRAQRLARPCSSDGLHTGNMSSAISQSVRSPGQLPRP